MKQNLLHRNLQQLILGTIVVLTVGVFAIQADAQQAGGRPASSSADQLFKSITRVQMKSIMDSEGSSVTPDDDGDLVWKIDGFKSFLFVAKDETSIQFHASFKSDNTTVRKVNEWNRTMRYSKTYLDSDGDPHLELDLDLAGGVTRARIIDFLKTCTLSFGNWKKQVVE